MLLLLKLPSMWLLNTKTLEMKSFANTPRFPYAILSHVWQHEDQSYNFQKIQDIYARFRNSLEGAVAHAPDKVRAFCHLAAEEGYEWAWLDTSCIDKTSSAELSEAINSMYAWYAASDVCYAYLYDVCDADNPFEPDSDFSKSEWHERGWTLQELLAPKRTVFLSGSWRFFGTKASLIAPLVQRTGIDRDVLLGNKMIDAPSVAQRMSWAATRKTTREEDRAYSLMGIFGVNMPIIYGEGDEKAFLRLQKEVIAICPDQSIFAWGPIHDDFHAARAAIERFGPSEDHGSTSQPMGGQLGLFATSPADFADSAGVHRFDPRLYQSLFGHAIDHKCTFSADGVAVRLPTWSRFARLDGDRAVFAAALACGTTGTHATVVGDEVAVAGRTDAAEETMSTDYPEVVAPHNLVSIVFLFLTGLHSDVDHRDELSFQYVGQLAQDETGHRQHYRAATLRLPILRHQWDSQSPLELRSFFPELAHLYLRDMRIYPSRGSLSSALHSEPSTKAMLPRHCEKYILEVPHWVFNRLEMFYGLVSSASYDAQQTVHQASRFTFPGDRNSNLDNPLTSYLLFTDVAGTETLGIVFSLQCESTAIGRGEIGSGGWCIRMFIAPGNLDCPDLGIRDVLAALAVNELVPECRPSCTPCNKCRHLHLLAVSNREQPVVFPVRAGSDDRLRAVRVWTTFSELPVRDGSHAFTGRFVVSMDLVGFPKVHLAARTVGRFSRSIWASLSYLLNSALRLPRFLKNVPYRTGGQS